MDAETLASRLDYVCALLRRLPADQPARLVVDDDQLMLLVDTVDARRALHAMFKPGTVARQTRLGAWRVKADGVVVLVQEPTEPLPSWTEIKL